MNLKFLTHPAGEAKVVARRPGPFCIWRSPGSSSVSSSATSWRTGRSDRRRSCCSPQSRSRCSGSLFRPRSLLLLQWSWSTFLSSLLPASLTEGHSGFLSFRGSHVLLVGAANSISLLLSSGFLVVISRFIGHFCRVTESWCETLGAISLTKCSHCYQA